MRLPHPPPGIALLDLEGVVVETAAARCEALRLALADAGLAPTDTAPALAAPGASTAAAIARAFAAARDRAAGGAASLSPHALDATAEELAVLRAERHLAERLAQGVSLAPGAAEAVAALAARLHLGVVTALRRREATELLAHAGLDACVGVVVAAEDAPRPRPAPDGHARALARLARRAGPAAAEVSAIAIESAPAGVAAAHAAGLPVLGVGDAVAPRAPRAGTDAPDAWVPAVAGVTYDSLFALLSPAPPSDR